MSNPTDVQNYKHYAAQSGNKNMKEVHIMDKSLKGVLAHYGVEEVITRLKDVLAFTVFDPTCETATEIKEEIEQHSNDVELISSIMESYAMTDGDGQPSVLNTLAKWEFPQDKADFEAEADNIIIAKSL